MNIIIAAVKEYKRLMLACLCCINHRSFGYVTYKSIELTSHWRWLLPGQPPLEVSVALVPKIPRPNISLQRVMYVRNTVSRWYPSLLNVANSTTHTQTQSSRVQLG